MSSTNLHASSTETSSGVSSGVSVNNTLIGLFVNVSSASGTLPTLVVKLQHSPNGIDWYDVSGMVSGSLGTISLTSLVPSSSQLVADTVRAVWTIGGVNPSFTFTIDIETAG